MQIQYVVTIDPGLSGGICLYDMTNKLVVEVYKMPVTKDAADKNVINVKVLNALFLRLRSFTDLVVIERQRAAATDGYKSSRTTMINYGILLGFLDFNNFKVIEVGPTTWQTILRDVVDPLVPKSKKATKRKSIALSGNKHDGIADAVCMAIYYHQINSNNY